MAAAVTRDQSGKRVKASAAPNPKNHSGANKIAKLANARGKVTACDAANGDLTNSRQSTISSTA